MDGGYWFFASLVGILSLSNSVLSVTRIIQVSNGRSMLDSDAPAGLKLRKWFLFTICAANTGRLTTTLFEVLYVSWWSMKPSTVWMCRCYPSLLFLLTAAFVTHYLGNLYYSLQGSEGRKFRLIWLIITLLFALTEVVCLSILSTVSPATSLLLLHFTFLVLCLHSAIILLAVWYFTFAVWRSFWSGNNSSAVAKVMVRMLLLICAVTICLLVMLSLRLDEYSTFAAESEIAVFTANQWIVLFIGEGICSLIMILVITNTFSPIETHLRAMLLKSIGNSHQSSVSTPSFSSPVAMNKGAAALLQLTSGNNSSSRAGEQQLLLSHSSTGIRPAGSGRSTLGGYGVLGLNDNSKESGSNSSRRGGRGGYDAIPQQQPLQQQD